jgi:2,4-dienoyl-CoA reductase-like NADH-dependent reductase (Old Yellow Enzyme family)
MRSPTLLNAPLTLPNGATIANRIAKAAMTEGLADTNAYPSAALERLYAQWAGSGCGVLITGNVMIDRQHLERPGNVVIDRAPDPRMRIMLSGWARAAQSGGAKIWMQINHAGRQTQVTVNSHPKAPSAIKLGLPGKKFGVPQALTEAEILDLIERFANAALVARDTGFDGVQIHAAHGYLLSSFLNPRANQRRDVWGGSLENRARILLETVKAVRAKTGNDFTLTVKLNSADFQKGGFTFADCTEVVSWLAQHRIDLVEISGGNYEQARMMDLDGIEERDLSGLQPSTKAREAYFADFAAQMLRDVRVPLMVTGGFRSAAAMESAVAEDGIAMIGIGRPMCVDTHCVQKLLRGELAQLEQWEKRLRLGPGWLGPHSPSNIIKMLNGFGVTYWFYQQFRRIGRGQAVARDLSVLSALRSELKEQKGWLLAANRSAFKAKAVDPHRGPKVGDG